MTNISLINDTAWQEAKRRAEVIRPLVSGDKLSSQELVREAAEQLSLSVRQAYELIRSFRLSDGLLSALVPFGHNGGRDGSKSPVGVTRAGIVYELFFTTLPQQAFTACDVVELYLLSFAFEPVLSDKDQEIDPDDGAATRPGARSAGNWCPSGSGT